MNEAGFKAWLLGEGRDRAVKPSGATHRVDRLRKIEENLAGLGLPFPDLDAAYEADGLTSAIKAIRQLQQDHKTGGQKYRLLMPDSERPKNRLANLRTFLGQYRDYRAGAENGDKDADRVRQHGLEAYIIPAREEGKSLVTISAKAVNEALGLNKGWRNIQQALTGPKFLEMAEVQPPIRKGPSQSTTTAFTYYLDDDENLTPQLVEEVLTIQFGTPITSSQKIFAVQSPDGRQIAVEREVKGTPLVWIEMDRPPPGDVEIKRRYTANEPRHSNLPPRLGGQGPSARPVAICLTPTWMALLRLMKHHGDPSQIVIDQTDPSNGGEIVSQTPSPTNLILYGPPGTGKTYATAAEAVALCSPGFAASDRASLMDEYRRLADLGRIEFVTFHQSYSYEDFVEGLRPPVGEDDGREKTDGFRLELSPGVFHRIATRARASRGSTAKLYDLADRRVFKMSIGEAANPDEAYLFEKALADGHVLLGFGDVDWSDARFSDRQAIIERRHEVEGDAREPATTQSARVKCPDAFRNIMKAGDLIIVSKGNSAFRAIGEVTGPYEYAPGDDLGYVHRRAVNWLWHDPAGAPVEDILNKRFSQLTLYQLPRSDLNEAALQRYLTSEQADGPPEQFVLIIDEINRANISKVFGELITLLEPDKRATPDGGGLQVRLPYSKELFGVPANLHVLGTMNTADRSIALLDTALRRRFAFRELMPDPDLPALKVAGEACGVDLASLLRTLNERIEYLFDREHQIGHAYFLGCSSRAQLDAVMRHKVIPLLAEYFYEDWGKVALVLGDANGSERFLRRTDLAPPAGLDDDLAETRHRWGVREAFAPDCYAAFQ